MDDLFGDDPKELRDEALSRLLKKPEYVPWKEKAMAVLYTFPFEWTGMGEDARHIVEAKIGKVPDDHLWGAVWNLAVMRGYFRATGEIRAPKDAPSHASEKKVWRRTRRGNPLAPIDDQPTA